MNIELREEIIQFFVAPSKRERLLGFLHSKKRRESLIDEFDSPGIFDLRKVTEIEGPIRNGEDLPNEYKRLGMGGRVYIMSANDEWDDQIFQMSYIVGECTAMCIDTIGYCWKTKTAFFEWHHSGSSYFLKGVL